MRISVALLCLLATTAIAKPKPPAKSAPAAPQIKLTPEIEKFAREMASDLDKLDEMAKQAEAMETAEKYPKAIATWQGIRLGAATLENHAALAARVGSFGEPMRFATKRGKLTPGQYVVALRKLGSDAGVRTAKATEARRVADARTRKRGFVEGVAVTVVRLEAYAKEAERAAKRAPRASMQIDETAQRLAIALRKNVASAIKDKRADAATRYPLQPKPATADEVVARLDKVIEAAKSHAKGLEAAAEAAAKQAKAQAAAKQAKQQPAAVAAAQPRPSTPAATRPGAPTRTAPVAAEPATEAPADEPAAAAPANEAQPVVEPVEGETCNGTFLDCNMFGLPCCPGLQCLYTTYVCGEGCDGTTGFTPTRYECGDPAITPGPP